MFELRHRFRLFAVWVLIASALLMANPLLHFGWIELMAITGPLLMAVERRIWREAALAIGVPAITLVWLAEGEPHSVLRLLVGWLVYAGGVALAARAIDAESELETIVGSVAFERPPPEGIGAFEVKLDRELARSRRHERPLVVLSVAAHPGAFEDVLDRSLHTSVLSNLASDRARLELRDFLEDELHIYAEVVATAERVLALVPEVDAPTAKVLVARLREAASERLDFAIQIGIGRFPTDAVCAEELIAEADRSRAASKLMPIREHVPDDVGHEPAALSPDGLG